MSALLEEVRVEPRRIGCPSCSDVVLEVALFGEALTILVDPVEVLPLMRCPGCRSGRQRIPPRYRKRGGIHAPDDGYFTRDQPCWRCGSEPGEAPALSGSRRPGSPGPGWVGDVVLGPVRRGYASLTFLGVLIDEAGRARIVSFDRVRAVSESGVSRIVDPRFVGPALHRAHPCGSVRAAL